MSLAKRVERHRYTHPLKAMDANSAPVKHDKTSKTQGLKPTVFWRIAEDIPHGLSWLLMVLSVVVPFTCWWLLAIYGDVNPTFLPSPPKVMEAFGDLWYKYDTLKQQDTYPLVQATIMSCFRVGSGFFLASVLAVPIGIGMGAFASLRALGEPIIGIVRYMPAPAFIPLLLIYLGLEEEPKIALIFIGTIFFNVLMIMDAVKFVPKELIETTYTLGGNREQVLLQVITPYVIPRIIDAFRVNMAASWNLVVVAELVAADEGLGKRILLAQRFNSVDEIFVCLIVLGFLGFGLDILFRWLQHITCRWAIE